jgi:hypothetical protein
MQITELSKVARCSGRAAIAIIALQLEQFAVTRLWRRGTLQTNPRGLAARSEHVTRA